MCELECGEMGYRTEFYTLGVFYTVRTLRGQQNFSSCLPGVGTPQPVWILFPFGRGLEFL